MLNSTEHEFTTALKTKLLKNKDYSRFQTLRWRIFSANKCYNANNCWHLDIYELGKFHEHEKCFITLGPD